MHNFKYKNRKLNLEDWGGGIAPFLLAAICIYDHMRKEKVMTHLWIVSRVRGTEMAEALGKQQRGLLSQDQKPRTCFPVRPRTRLKAHRLASQWDLKIIHNYWSLSFLIWKNVSSRNQLQIWLGDLRRNPSQTQSILAHVCGPHAGGMARRQSPSGTLQTQKRREGWRRMVSKRS